MWRADGWDARWRIGLLTPHAAVGSQSELRAMAPLDVGLHVARVWFGAMTRRWCDGPDDPARPGPGVRRTPTRG